MLILPNLNPLSELQISSVEYHPKSQPNTSHDSTLCLCKEILIFKTTRQTPPKLTFQAHMAPLDIAFNNSGNDGWVTFHGSWYAQLWNALEA